jgi:hypothetical protein
MDDFEKRRRALLNGTVSPQTTSTSNFNERRAQLITPSQQAGQDNKTNWFQNAVDSISNIAKTAITALTGNQNTNHTPALTPAPKPDFAIGQPQENKPNVNIPLDTSSTPTSNASATPTVTPQSLKTQELAVQTTNAIDSFLRSPIDSAIKSTQNTIYQSALDQGQGKANYGEQIVTHVAQLAANDQKRLIEPILLNRATAPITKGLVETYLGSSQKVIDTLNTAVPETNNPVATGYNTVGEIVGQTIAFLAGGEVLKGLQFGKATLPALFAITGQTSASANTTMQQRLEKLPVDAFAGWLLSKIPASRKIVSADTLKTLGLSTAVLSGNTFVDSLIQGMRPKDAALASAKMAIVAGLFHIGGTATGLFTNKLLNSQYKEAAFEMTPEQARTQVNATDLKGTPAGDVIIRAARQAEAEGKNLQIVGQAAKKSKVATLFNADTPQGLSFGVNLVEPKQIQLLSEQGSTTPSAEKPVVASPSEPGAIENIPQQQADKSIPSYSEAQSLIAQSGGYSQIDNAPLPAKNKYAADELGQSLSLNPKYLYENATKKGIDLTETLTALDKERNTEKRIAIGQDLMTQLSTPAGSQGQEKQLIHGTNNTIATINKEGLHYSRNASSLLGKAVYFTDSPHTVIDHGGNYISLSSKNFNLKEFKTLQEQEQFVKDSNTKNLADALRKEGKYDGFIIPNPDPTVGSTIGLVNLDKVNQHIVGKNIARPAALNYQHLTQSVKGNADLQNVISGLQQNSTVDPLNLIENNDFEAFKKQIADLAKHEGGTYKRLHDIIQKGNLTKEVYDESRQLIKESDNQGGSGKAATDIVQQGVVKEGESSSNSITSGSKQASKETNPKEVTSNAAKGATAIGSFEPVEPGKSEIRNFKLHEQVKALIKKYARQIGEGYLPKGAVGAHFRDTQNIRVSGINDLSVAAHEIAHFLDQKNEITKVIQKNSELSQEITEVYLAYYPTARETDAFNTRVVEGYATLLQKYMEMPRTMEKEYPKLVNTFLKPGGEAYRPVIGEIINDLQKIIADYQGLSPLDKIAARVADSALKTGKKSFLNIGEKIRTFIEDEIYPLEKVAKLSGDERTVDDPSLWLRQYSRGGGIYANNILNPKTGYWALNETGDFVKTQEFNWKNLQDHLAKEKVDNSFNSYLIARDQYFEWQEFSKLEATYNRLKPILDLGQKYGVKIEDIVNNSEMAKKLGMDVNVLIPMIKEAQAAEKAYLEQKRYLDNNGFTQDEVTAGYLENKDRFAKEEEMYDKLVKEDLKLLHNRQVQLVDKKIFDELDAKEGYASMKRAFYDELVGDEKAAAVGTSTTGANKASSLLRRTGGQQQILPPVINSMMNHIEIVKKSMKQIVYNKIGSIADKAVVPDLMQKVELETVRRGDHTEYPQDKDPKIIMARQNYKRSPILVDALVRRTVDTTLTFQSMNIFEHLLVNAGRIFTIGTTGAYAPFSLVNFPADQWNAVVNTRNGYVPLVDTIKILRKAIVDKKGEFATYWHEWEIMGGDRMTLFQAQMGAPDEARKYVLQEKKGIEKVINLIDKGVDIFSLPAKYSETVSRFTEYAKARQSGKAQVVALEDAGRVTAPFHHIGSWRFGDKATAKFVFRSIPFGNASLQVVAQTIRSGSTKDGKKRIFFAMLAMTAAYLASMGIVSLLGSKDQKEQYKDLRPQDISLYVHFPALGGNGLSRVRVSQELSTVGTVLSMIIAQNVLGTQYSVQDYKDALTNWIPKQFDILSPVEMFLSWFNPVIKVPIELLFNTKDYPRISPIENLSMLSKEPRFRFNESTSALAKKMGDIFNISPIKTDFLIQGLFGRATGFLTGKPNIYNPTSQIQRDYFFTLGRRIENFYNLQTTNNQEYKAIRPDKAGKVAQQVSPQERTRIVTTHTQLKIVTSLLDDYGKIDEKKYPERAKAMRDRIINQLSKVNIR